VVGDISGGVSHVLLLLRGWFVGDMGGGCGCGGCDDDFNDVDDPDDDYHDHHHHHCPRSTMHATTFVRNLHSPPTGLMLL
jgi:hypothetical protein